MKATRLVALLLAAIVVLLSPSAASAYTPPGSGVSNNGSSPSGGGCYTTTFTVQGAAGDSISFELRDGDGALVYNDTKTADADGVATFTVEQCEPGEYVGTAFASDGSQLGSSTFVVPAGAGGGSQGGDNAGGSAGSGGGAGALPSTGSSTRDMLALGGGLALLMVGGVAFVAARRRTA